MAIDRYTSNVSIPQTISPVNGTFTIDCSTGTNFFLNASGTGVFENEMNTPTYVGGKVQAIAPQISANTNVSLTDLTGGVATQPATGDVVIVAYSIPSSGGDRDVTITSGGWIELADVYVNDTNEANLGVFYRVMGASPDTSLNVGPTYEGAAAGAVAVHVWRNIDTTNPIDTITTTSTTTNSPLPNPPEITTVTGNAVVLAIGAGAGTAGSTAFTQGGDLSNFITIAGNSTEDGIIGIGSIATTSVGAVNPLAFTAPTGTTADSAVAATVALRPTIKTAAIPITVNFTNATTLRSDINVDLVYTKFYASTINTFAPTIAWSSSIVQLATLPTIIYHNQAVSYSFYSQSTKVYSLSNNLITSQNLYLKTDYIKSTSTWTAPSDVTRIEVLLCGGGGGSEGNFGGHGSAIYESLNVTPGQSYTITIGAGGTGGATATAGSNSSFANLLTAVGGGVENTGVPGNIGGYGESFNILDSTDNYLQLYGLKVAGYDENYGRGGSRGSRAGAANTGQGGGLGTGTTSGSAFAGGSGVAIIKYYSAQ